MAASIGDVFFKVGVNTAQFKQGLNTSVKSLRAWKAQAAKITRDATTPIDKYNQKRKETQALFATGKIKVNEYRNAMKTLRQEYQKNSGATAQLAASAKAAATAQAEFAAAQAATISTSKTTTLTSAQAAMALKGVAVTSTAAAAGISALTAATAILLGPLAAVYGVFKLVKVTEEVDQAMHQSLAIMGNVSNEMKAEMKSLANEIAGDTVFSTTELAKAFFYLSSAGLSTKQTLIGLKPVAMFAQAGMFDLSQATELLAGSVAALGLASKDEQQYMTNLTRVSDVLVGANTLAQATTEQFAQALGTKAAASSRFFNMEVEETVAVLAVLAKNMIKGSDAGTAFDIALRELTNKAIMNAKAFEDAGVKIFTANGKFVGFANAIGSLEKHLAGMSHEQKTAAMMTLGFTAKSIANIKVMMGQSDAIRGFTKRLEEMGGTTKRVSDNQMTDFKKGWEAIKAAVVDFADFVSKPILWPLGKSLEAIAGLLNSIRKGFYLTQTAIVEFSKAAIELTPESLLPVDKTILLEEFAREIKDLRKKWMDTTEDMGKATGSTKDAMNKVAGATRNVTNGLKDTVIESAKLKENIEDSTIYARELRKTVGGWGDQRVLPDSMERSIAAKKVIADLRREIDLLGTTQKKIDTQNAREYWRKVKGKTNIVGGEETLNRLIKEKKEKQGMFDLDKKMVDLGKRAAQARESLRTPIQQYQETIADYRKMLEINKLTKAEFVALEKREWEKLPTKKATTSRSNVTPALERFSQAAHKVIVGSTTSPEIQNQKKMITELKDGNGVAGDILDELKNRPAIGVAPGVN